MNNGLHLLMAQLVRCMFKLVLFYLLGFSQTAVDRRAKPSSNLKIFKGVKLLMKTQILKSNLQPSIRRGFIMYSWTTFGYLQSCSSYFVRQIPFPCELAEGLTISHFLFFSFSYCYCICADRAYDCSGRIQVSGQKSYYLEKVLFIFLMFSLNKFFLPSYCELGKWLIL